MPGTNVDRKDYREYFIDLVRTQADGAKTYHLVYRSDNMRKSFNFWKKRIYQAGTYIFDCSLYDNVYHLGDARIGSSAGGLQ